MKTNKIFFTLLINALFTNFIYSSNEENATGIPLPTRFTNNRILKVNRTRMRNQMFRRHFGLHRNAKIRHKRRGGSILLLI